MTKYVSLVLTGYEQEIIKRVEKVLEKAGIKSNYGEFKPAIPNLRANFTLTVVSSPDDAPVMRRRVEMVLAGFPGGNEVNVKEFTVQQHKGGDK